VLAFLLAGCFSGTGADLSEFLQSCRRVEEKATSDDFEILLPAASAGQIATKFKLNITTQDKDVLSVVALWMAWAGSARIVFDGPTGRQSSTNSTWIFMQKVPEGNYHIEVEGAPAAFVGEVLISIDVYRC
jgi:hypothetical protein